MRHLSRAPAHFTREPSELVTRQRMRRRLWRPRNFCPEDAWTCTTTPRKRMFPNWSVGGITSPGTALCTVPVDPMMTRSPKQGQNRSRRWLYVPATGRCRQIGKTRVNFAWVLPIIRKNLTQNGKSNHSQEVRRKSAERSTAPIPCAGL